MGEILWLIVFLRCVRDKLYINKKSTLSRRISVSHSLVWGSSQASLTSASAAIGTNRYGRSNGVRGGGVYISKEPHMVGWDGD